MRFLFLSAMVLLLIPFPGCYEQASHSKSLEEIASDFNKECPRMIDSETKIEGIEIKGKNTVIYKYILVNLFARNVDTSAFKRALWPGILSLVKASSDLKGLREENTNFEYCYKDRLNALIYTFKIYPKDYK